MAKQNLYQVYVIIVVITFSRNHTPQLFSNFFPTTDLIIDGTYFYTSKSEDFDSQKKSFSMYVFPLFFPISIGTNIEIY